MQLVFYLLSTCFFSTFWYGSDDDDSDDDDSDDDDDGDDDDDYDGGDDDDNQGDDQGDADDDYWGDDDGNDTGDNYESKNSSHSTYVGNFQIVRRLSYKVSEILQLKNIINVGIYFIPNIYWVGQTTCVLV